MTLECKNICFGYTKETQILKNISFKIDENEIVGLVAPSGFGKTTLAKILSGHLKPSKGEIMITPPVKQSQHPVQLILQHPEKAVNPRWKMSKILNENWNVTEKIREIMGIKTEWLNRWPNELSGGELQRFCIARALSPNTKFLIADEMTTMLDAVSQAEVWKAVLQIAKENKIGLMVISHDKALLNRICTRLVYL